MKKKKTRIYKVSLLLVESGKIITFSQHGINGKKSIGVYFHYVINNLWKTVFKLCKQIKGVQIERNFYTSFSYFLIGSMIVNLINWNVDTCDADEVILWTPWNWDRIVPLNVMLGILYTVSTRVFFTREY